jgi:hypothetical protein
MIDYKKETFPSALALRHSMFSLITQYIETVSFVTWNVRNKLSYTELGVLITQTTVGKMIVKSSNC